MKRESTVSVVIATGGRAETLCSAIESALDQTGISVEVLVVDDTADGSVRPVVERIADHRVKYLRHTPPSRGRPALARNLAWPDARGEFVYFLDDDDRVASGALAALCAALEAHPATGVAVGTVEPFGVDAEIVAHSRRHFQRAARALRTIRSKRRLVATLLFSDSIVNGSAFVIRREALAHVGGYAADVARCEGLELCARAVRRFGFVFVDRTVLHYRIDASSLMHGSSEAALVAAYRAIHRRYRQEYGGIDYAILRCVSLLTSPARVS